MFLIEFEMKITTRAKKGLDMVENGAPNDTQKKRKINDINSIALSTSKKETAKDEEARKIRALREEFEQMEQRVTIDNIMYALHFFLNSIMDILL